jgi:hypothetical protein
MSPVFLRGGPPDFPIVSSRESKGFLPLGEAPDGETLARLLGEEWGMREPIRTVECVGSGALKRGRNRWVTTTRKNLVKKRPGTVDTTRK